MTLTCRIALIVSVMAMSIAIDLSTKVAVRAGAEALPRYYLGGLVRISYWENAGTFMGLGDHWSKPVRFWAFSALVGAMAVAIIGLILVKPTLAPATVIAGSLIAGGSLSNVIDRLMHQEQVLDFISIVVMPMHLVIFNVADVAIASGIMIFGVSAFRRKLRRRTRIDVRT